jgi:hypothetical protein
MRIREQGIIHTYIHIVVSPRSLHACLAHPPAAKQTAAHRMSKKGTAFTEKNNNTIIHFLLWNIFEARLKEALLTSV